MAVQVEIVDAKQKLMRAALYYSIPPGRQLSAAVDLTRVPEGVRLSPAELDALKQGALYELIREFNIPPKASNALVERILEREWERNRDRALQEYQREYGNTQLTGFFWDGTSWSNP